VAAKVPQVGRKEGGREGVREGGKEGGRERAAIARTELLSVLL